MVENHYYGAKRITVKFYHLCKMSWRISTYICQCKPTCH